MHTNIARYGIILNTENFEECVAFYRDLFGLRQLFEKKEGDFKLACLDYGNGYLMVEQGGKAKNGVKSPKEGSFKLRFNVEDLEEALAGATTVPGPTAFHRMLCTQALTSLTIWRA